MGTMRDLKWAVEASDKIKEKMLVVTKRSHHKIPYTTLNGIFNDCTENICWWTNGFWGGMMWQLYNATQEDVYKKAAIENEIKLDKNLMNYWGMDHDSGFKWLTTSVANYRLTGNKESHNRGLLAAANLAGRFNPVGKFIRAWNDNGDEKRAGWAIIDSMMNLPLLYWAYKETGDFRYMHIAKLHADTVIKNFVREDGSVKHIVEFNSETGDYVQDFGGQGYEQGSSWTRGQAWGLYGFTLSYIHTREERYLDCAKKIANYFIANIPENGLMPVDFRQPSDCRWEDSTASAIAACGLLELGKFTGSEETDKYEEAALKLLKTLHENRSNYALDCDNIIEKCTAAYHDENHEFSIIYGDYYYIEAIWKLTNQEIFIW